MFWERHAFLVVYQSIRFKLITMYAEHFSLANIPFGIASSVAHPAKSVVTRLHDNVIFLDKVAEAKALEGLTKELIESLSQVRSASLQFRKS